jgi:hypothetical protein
LVGPALYFFWTLFRDQHLQLEKLLLQALRFD